MGAKKLVDLETSKQKSEAQYGDTLIKALFRDEKRAIELCNAVTGSNYSEDTNVQLCELDNSLVRRYNDLAFAIDKQLLFMIEHQSGISPNLPLRFLSYITDILYSWFVRVDELYGKKLYKIPAPKCYVLYNGTQALKEKTLKLSEAFYINDEKVSLELIVEIIDVNYSNGSEVLQKSKSLEGYSYLMDLIRRNLKEGLTRDKAISLAIDYCIKNEVLSEFLQENYSEVGKMINLQYNKEAEFEIIRQEAKEEGRLEERAKAEAEKLEEKIKIVKKLLKMNLTTEQIVEATGLAVEDIEKLNQS